MNNQLEPGQKNSDFEDLARFGFSILFTTIARYILRIAKNAVISRILGPSGRGIFGLVTLVPDALVNMGHLGLGQANMFYLGKRKYQLHEVAGTSIALAFIIGTALSGIGYVLVNTPWLYKQNFDLIKIYMPVILIIVPIYLLSRYLESILFSVKDIHFINITDLLNSILPITFFLILFVILHDSLSSAVFGWALSTVIICILFFVRLFKFCTSRLRLSFSYIKSGLFFGFKAYLGDILGFLLLRVDFFFVSAFLGTRELGFYMISVSMAELLLSLPDAVVMPAIPAILNRKDNKSHKFTPAVTRCVLSLVAVGCILTAICGKIGILILFGREFLPAYWPLLYLLPGMVVRSVYPILRTEILGRNRPGTISIFSGTSLLCNILLNIYLIPRMGICGAALSSSIAYAVATFLAMWTYVSKLDVQFKEVIIVQRSDVAMINNYLMSKVKRIKNRVRQF